MKMDGDVMRRVFVATATVLMAQAACGPLAAQPRSESGIAGVSVFGRPPPDFNPLTASDAQLDEYGFPPRPNRDLGPEARARWEQRVMSQTRIVPELAQTNVFHGLVKGIKPGKTTPWQRSKRPVRTGAGTPLRTRPTHLLNPVRRSKPSSSCPSRRRAALRAAPRLTARPIGSGSMVRYRTTCFRPAPKPISIAALALPTMRGSSGFPIRKSRSRISRSRQVI